MSNTYEQYRRFLGWLAHEHIRATPDVRRTANLVEAHFREVHATTSAARSRSGLVSRLLQQEFAGISDELPAITEQAEQNAVPCPTQKP
ncbi:hypothetical protein D3879_15290 [Pseudomonas cavernicola]|uniref:Uncharacterized protein n=1 Tax=Pseudomonas cavernicola TaxID=2320866 RepID=A0A418XES6_9PSED|nr:hypothetical protein D3879_15290 [Pseudomonas cavernicola]